ncbi:MAG: hypothetical protein HQL71_09435, partial [Magnetococcales bacterium]|nr:hypothetical protein [Magnetococcales bacterium]
TPNNKTEPTKTVKNEPKSTQITQQSTVTKTVVNKSVNNSVIPNKLIQNPKLWNFLSQRIESTKEWLNKSDKKLYTIQLMMASTRKDEWLKEVYKTHGLKNRTFYIRPVPFKGNTHYFVYLNEYDSYSMARNDIKGLSRYFSRSGPFVAEISRISNSK